jgi:hypothetical protein
MLLTSSMDWGKSRTSGKLLLLLFPVLSNVLGDRFECVVQGPFH